MRTFRRLGLIGLLAVCLFGFAACGDDDDDENNVSGGTGVNGGGGGFSILDGKWMLVEEYDVNGGNPYTTTYEDPNNTEYVYISGSTIKFTGTYNGQETTDAEGTFTLNGEVMTLNVIESDGDSDTWHYIYGLLEDNNKLILKDQDENRPNEYYTEWYYKRVQ